MYVVKQRRSTMMPHCQLATKPMLIAIAMLACSIPLLAGFFFVASAFGVGAASVLLLFLIPPLIVALRLPRRWLTVRRREVVYLAILCCAAFGAIFFVVRDWYDKGMDHSHAEDIQWAKFEQLLRRDQAFRNVVIKLTDRKHIYWVEGTVSSEEDLNRLRSLAFSCGIKQERLDGPYVYSISLRVAPQEKASQER
jgi:hypothetical protein